MYKGLNENLCQLAWELVKPLVIKAAGNSIIKRRAGTIVVCRPGQSPGDQLEVLFMAQVDSNYPDAAEYSEIALAKARVSLRTGLPSRTVQQDAPHLYESGMTKWGGSVIENGLIVAFSGVEAIFDEAIASTMLRWVVTLCQHEMTRPHGVMSKDTSYIGETLHPHRTKP